MSNFTNSPLVEYTRISPNKNNGRWDWENNKPVDKITKITIHHMAGVGTLESFGNIVANPARQMSANYAIDKDARVGLFCEEKDRSWCSSSKLNDNVAVTIEVSNSQVGGNWPISDKVLAKLIDLCVDICKRNGIPKLTFTGKPDGSLTYHYMFAQTGCPGPYIQSKTQYICDQVNRRLNTPASTAPTGTAVSYTKQLTAGTVVYKTAGGYATTTIQKTGVYTIVEEAVSGNTKYGKLKSGIGWVKLGASTTSTAIKKGDIVKVLDPIIYGTNKRFTNISSKYYVLEVSGSRAVISTNNKDVTAAIDVKYLQKI